MGILAFEHAIEGAGVATGQGSTQASAKLSRSRTRAEPWPSAHLNNMYTHIENIMWYVDVEKDFVLSFFAAPILI